MCGEVKQILLKLIILALIRFVVFMLLVNVSCSIAGAH
jgi:hypothetical protein